MDIFIILDWITRIFRKEFNHTPTYLTVGLTINELIECLLRENKITRTQANILKDIISCYIESAESGEI